MGDLDTGFHGLPPPNHLESGTGPYGGQDDPKLTHLEPIKFFLSPLDSGGRTMQ